MAFVPCHGWNIPCEQGLSSHHWIPRVQHPTRHPIFVERINKPLPQQALLQWGGPL